MKTLGLCAHVVMSMMSPVSGIMVLLGCTSIGAPVVANSQSATGRAQSQNKPPELQAAVEKAQYGITRQENAEQPVYHAPNAAQDFRSVFKRDGLHVTPMSGEGAQWDWSLCVTGYGRGEALQPLPLAKLVSKDNRIEYRRGPVTEWYVNDTRGVEQGFTIRARPGVPASRLPLRLQSTASGDLEPTLSRDAQSVSFITPVYGDATTGNNVQGNYIGTNGTGALPNAGGILIKDAPNNTVGGVASTAGNAPGNVISGNTRYDGDGIRIKGNTATGNKVRGNRIGLAAASTEPLRNGRNGLLITGGAHGNSIGSPAEGTRNIIAGNPGDGVGISGDGSIGNRVRGNSIYKNGGLGINLGKTGEPAGTVTLNDNDDPDTGPNNLQNFPIITGVSNQSGRTVLTGVLNSLPNQTFTLDFFRTPDADESGFGEGKIYLGSLNAKTSATGFKEFTFSVDGLFTGQFFTATATSPSGDTSEFSRAKTETPNQGQTSGSLRVSQIPIGGLPSGRG